MNILLYRNNDDKITKKLWKIILETAPNYSAEKYYKIGDLNNRLRQQRDFPTIILISADGKREFQRLLILRELFKDTKIILVLPDRDKNHISMAHSFFPRYLTYIDGNFEDVKAVLGKMLEKYPPKC